ncbi:MAG: hypothetical protein Ta2A_08380 [Treponemataceae bacterium]|nr:MAG: hypothetical protein Ta2A_08380 [Treponemataceae bacterium]
MLIFTLALSALNIVLWLIFFVHLRKKFSSESVLRDIRIEVNKVLTEIQVECDRDITVIDARIKGLKSLIEEADKRIKTAQHAVEFAQKHDVPFDARQEIAHNEISKRAQKAAELSRTIYSNVITPKQVSPNASTSPNIITSPNADILSNAQVHKIVAEKTLREKVLSLNAEGFTPELIAEKLAISVTEVHIVIDMNMPH